MFVKPARPGLVIRDPATGIPLPDDGDEVAESQFWLRRKHDGDVVAAKPNKVAPDRKHKKEG